MSSTRSTSDSTLVDHASTLPPELLVHILHCAQEGLTAPEQLQVRLTFESVCRSWFECEFRWKVVAVKGLDKAAKLLEVLTEMAPPVVSGRARRASARAGAEKAVAENVAGRIKTVHFTFTELGSKAKVAELASLIAMMVNVTQLEFAVTLRALLTPGDCLGTPVTRALAKLGSVEHFTITGLPGRDGRSPYIAANELKGLPKWPKLKSLTFRTCVPRACAVLPRVYRSPKLESIELDDACETWDKQPSSLVTKLGLAVHSLKLNHPDFFFRHQTLALINSSKDSLRAAKQLKTVTLADQDNRTHYSFLDQTRRGHLDQFVAALDNVSTLTISPCTVSDIASLAKLKQLTRLIVLSGVCSPIETVEPDEYVQLLSHSPSLEQLELSATADYSWNAADRRAVRDAAKGKVKLRWIEEDGQLVRAEDEDDLYRYSLEHDWDDGSSGCTCGMCY